MSIEIAGLGEPFEDRASLLKLQPLNSTQYEGKSLKLRNQIK